METGGPALEGIWRDLRPHLEWAEGFALVLLFAGHPQPVQFLRRRLEESLQLRTLRLTVLAPANPTDVPGVVEQILAARPGPGRGPLWVELWRSATEEGWPQARRQALHRLNERRTLLERDVGLPIVLILPQSERARVYVEAPDLWAVRAFTARLPPPAEPERMAGEITRSGENAPALGAAPAPAELEWARLWQQSSDRTQLNPWDGFAAFEAAIERGDLAAARVVAEQSLKIARNRAAAADGTPQALRDLSVSLNNVGAVERD
ncbi:MAG: hypothetical protein ACREET_11975, partial [Stellaceae bacterium]